MDLSNGYQMVIKWLSNEEFFDLSNNLTKDES